MAFSFDGVLLKDFGPWKENDKVYLCFDFEKGIVGGGLIDEDSKIIRKIELICEK